MKILLILALIMVPTFAISANAQADDTQVKEQIGLMIYQRMFCSARFTPEQNTWMRIEAERLIGSNDLIDVSTYLGTLAAPLFREKDAQARFCKG